MSFSIGQREVDEIAILDLSGRLTLGPPTEQLQGKADAMLQQGKTRVVLNFADAPYIDSSGLGLLVSLNAEYRSADGGLRLLNLSKRHLQLFVLTKLSTEFEIFDDEQSAIDSFYPDRARVRFDVLEFVKQQQAERSEREDAPEPEDG
jgi:anti-sigma B factor antagonist